MNQDYKTSLQPAINLGDKNFKIVEKIANIDYLQVLASNKSSLKIELSFILLDYKIIDLIISDENFTVKTADTEQAIQMCFNIWPKGRGVLH